MEKDLATKLKIYFNPGNIEDAAVEGEGLLLVAVNADEFPSMAERGGVVAKSRLQQRGIAV